MKNKTIKSIALLALCSLSLPTHAAVVYTANFDTQAVGSTIDGWTEEGLTGDNAAVEAGFNTTGDNSVYFNTGAGGLREEAIYADTSTANTSSFQFTLSYDLIGKTGQLYSGAFLAQIWAGTPGGGGLLLGEDTGINPAGGASQTNQLVVNGTSAVGNIFIRFYAQDADGAGNAAFEQARMDTVSLDASPIPEPSSGILCAFGGMLAICFRRRRA